MVKEKDNKKKARCTVRHKSKELSSSGRSALTDHAKGKKHKEIIEKRKVFFKTSSIRTDEKKNVSNAKNDIESQKTLDMHLYNSDTIMAEIIWTLKSVMDGFSVRSNDEFNETLPAMFPDSKIAGSFSMGRTKLMCAINHRIYPYFKSLLLSSLSHQTFMYILLAKV